MNAVDLTILKTVMQPVESARGLPNQFYTDADVFLAEREKVFTRNWMCIGFGKDVANPGDLRPMTFAGYPLLLVRDQAGELRVFQNVCRHRGMVLASEPGTAKTVIRCPYHSWCYNLDGSLRTTPHAGGPGRNTDPHIHRDELGLFAVRSHIWMDMVFVNISGDAPPFRDSAAALIERWKDFENRPLFHGGADSSTSFDLATNWKLAVENYCESYHLPWVHPGLNSYSKLEDHYNIVAPGAFSGQGTLVYNPQLGADGERFASFEGLSEKWRSGAEYAALYPNVLLGVHKDHFFAMLIEPVSQERTVERVEIYYAEEAMTGPAMAAMRARNSEMWRQVFAQDVFVVEGMQKGRHAPGFDGGKFSPAMDAATHCFHDWVARQFAA